MRAKTPPLLHEQTGALKQRGEELEAAAAAADGKLQELLQGLPNLPHESVPAGKSEHDNVIA